MAQSVDVQMTNREATLAKLKSLLSDSEKKASLGKAWFDSVAAMVQRQRTVLVAIMTLSFIPTTYLALFLLGKEPKLETAGFKFDSPITLYQLCLLAMSLLGIYGARVAVIIAQGEQLIEAWLLSEYEEDGADLYRFTLDPPLFEPPSFTNPVGMQPAHLALRNTVNWTFYSVAGTVGIAVGLTQLWALCWGIRHATLSDAGPNTWVVAFCVLITALNMFVYVPYGLKQRFKPKI
jgi:hypothetical protein